MSLQLFLSAAKRLKASLLPSSLLTLVSALLVSLLTVLSFNPAVNAFADTTFVSGAVSGEWTREGNPWILEDSTWVPEGERLTLREGVEVFFEEGTGLDIFGSMHSLGGERDNVTINVVEGVGHWRGIRYYGPQNAIINYTYITCPDTALYLDNESSLEAYGTMIEAEEQFLARYSGNPNEGHDWNLNLTWCTFKGALQLYAFRVSLRAENCTFDFDSRVVAQRETGFIGSGNNFEFLNCTVYGGVWNVGGQTYAEGCTFLQPRNATRIGVGILSESGMRDTYIEGDCGATGSRGQRMIYFENNTIQENFSISNINAIVSRCYVGGSISLSEGYFASIVNTTSRRGLNISDVDTVLVDSCVIGYTADMTNAIGVRSGEFGINYVKTTRSLIRCQQIISNERCAVIFDHNTFVFDMEGGTPMQHSSSEPDIFTNNIFKHATGRGRDLFSVYPDREPPLLRYNCFDGFENYIHHWELGGLAPDSTNLIADPRLMWIGQTPMLSAESPCIDAGDPNSRRDTDGTRTDMGAIAFNQANRKADSDTQIPQLFSVVAFPNPFNNSVSVSLTTPRAGSFDLQMFDLIGRMVVPLKKVDVLSGTQNITLDASSIPAGRYILRLQNGLESQSVPIVSMK